MGLIHQLARDLAIPRSVMEALAEEAAGHPVSSSKELTPSQASALIDALQERAERSGNEYAD